MYKRFNKNLFEEISVAFSQGRCAADPATFWYKGELQFFDNYIIPLAQKLKDCNVFGVTSDECLSFALRNRAEWENCGQAVVQNMSKNSSRNTPLTKSLRTRLVP